VAALGNGERSVAIDRRTLEMRIRSHDDDPPEDARRGLVDTHGDIEERSDWRY